MSIPNPQFSHERLHVYQRSLEFVAWATELLAPLKFRAAVKDQLDRASTSVPLNIAEGNGKFSVKDRCRFLPIAMGSALECAACLDVFVAKKAIVAEQVMTGKAKLQEVVAMLIAMIAKLSEKEGNDCRIREEEPEMEGWQ